MLRPDKAGKTDTDDEHYRQGEKDRAQPVPGPFCAATLTKSQCGAIGSVATTPQSEGATRVPRSAPSTRRGRD